MIIFDAINRSRELFEHSNFNIIYLINSYLLSVNYLKITKKHTVPDNEIEEMLQKFREFYFFTLQEAKDEIEERAEEESITEYTDRLRRKYHALRKGAYLYFQDNLKKIYSYIYLSTAVEIEDDSVIRKNLINKKTLLIMTSDYED